MPPPTKPSLCGPMTCFPAIPEQCWPMHSGPPPCGPIPPFRSRAWHASRVLASALHSGPAYAFRIRADPTHGPLATPAQPSPNSRWPCFARHSGHTDANRHIASQALAFLPCRTAPSLSEALRCTALPSGPCTPFPGTAFRHIALQSCRSQPVRRAAALGAVCLSHPLLSCRSDTVRREAMVRWSCRCLPACASHPHTLCADALLSCRAVYEPGPCFTARRYAIRPRRCFPAQSRPLHCCAPPSCRAASGPDGPMRCVAQLCDPAAPNRSYALLGTAYDRLPIPADPATTGRANTLHRKPHGAVPFQSRPANAGRCLP